MRQEPPIQQPIPGPSAEDTARTAEYNARVVQLLGKTGSDGTQEAAPKQPDVLTSAGFTEPIVLNPVTLPQELGQAEPITQVRPSRRTRLIAAGTAAAVLATGALTLASRVRKGSGELQGRAGHAVLFPGESGTPAMTVRTSHTTPGTTTVHTKKFLDPKPNADVTASASVAKKAAKEAQHTPAGGSTKVIIETGSGDLTAEGMRSMGRKEQDNGDLSDERLMNAQDAYKTAESRLGVRGGNITLDRNQSVLSDKEIAAFNDIAHDGGYANLVELYNAVVTGAETGKKYVNAVDKYIRDHRYIKYRVKHTATKPSTTVVTTTRTSGTPGTPKIPIVYYNSEDALGTRVGHIPSLWVEEPPTDPPTEPEIPEIPTLPPVDPPPPQGKSTRAKDNYHTTTPSSRTPQTPHRIQQPHYKGEYRGGNGGGNDRRGQRNR